MSLMTLAPAAIGPDDESSYNAGLFDGELAAITGLTSRRVHARASMADPYDPLYAQGLVDGFLAGVERNLAYAEKSQAA